MQQRPAGAGWRPFAGREGIRGGMSVKADGAMSWNGSSAEDVVRNRLRYFENEGLDHRRAVAADQVHGKAIHRVTTADAARGILERDTRIANTDGMVTNARGIILMTLHADCAPVFYHDREHHVIGLAHAGRRGILAGICGEMLRRMQADFGSDPRAIEVEVGPTVCTQAYPVEPALAEEFSARFGNRVVASDGTGIYLDLIAALTTDLLEAGLNPSFIPARPPCTATNPVYASYRRDGPPTRSMLAWLRIT